MVNRRKEVHPISGYEDRIQKSDYALASRNVQNAIKMPSVLVSRCLMVSQRDSNPCYPAWKAGRP